MRETDETIYLRYVREENPADLEELLARYRDGLLLYLYSYVRSSEDAEDILMDTFARLAVDKPPFYVRDRGSFKSWLYAIGRNNALMHIRRRRIQILPLKEDIPAEKDLPETVLLEKEKRRRLYQAIQGLKPEYARVLVLHYFDGMKAQEIEQAMGLGRRQVYNLMERGKKALRKNLEGMGLTDAEY